MGSGEWCVRRNAHACWLWSSFLFVVGTRCVTVDKWNSCCGWWPRQIICRSSVVCRYNIAAPGIVLSASGRLRESLTDCPDIAPRLYYYGQSVCGQCVPFSQLVCIMLYLDRDWTWILNIRIRSSDCDREEMFNYYNVRGHHRLLTSFQIFIKQLTICYYTIQHIIWNCFYRSWIKVTLGKV